MLNLYREIERTKGTFMKMGEFDRRSFLRAAAAAVPLTAAGTVLAQDMPGHGNHRAAASREMGRPTQVAPTVSTALPTVNRIAAAKAHERRETDAERAEPLR